jgi:outer membrane protein assembly factor BamE (lipoprotein component of BamABCDE complex)
MASPNKVSFILFICIILAGCCTYGAEGVKDPALIAKIQPGVTTQQEISGMFGPPFTKHTLSNGDYYWNYYFSKIRMITLPSDYTDPKPPKTDLLMIIFDKNSIVKEYKTDKVGY